MTAMQIYIDYFRSFLIARWVSEQCFHNLSWVRKTCFSYKTPFNHYYFRC